MNVNRFIARAIGVVVVSGAVALGPAAAAGAASQPLLPPGSPIQIGLGDGPVISLDPQTPAPAVPTELPAPSDLVGTPRSHSTASSDPDAVRVGSDTSTPTSTPSGHHAVSAHLPVDVCVSRSLLTGSRVNGCGTSAHDRPSLVAALESVGACIEQAIGLGGSAADCGVAPGPGVPSVPGAPSLPGAPAVPGAPSVPALPGVPASPVPGVPGVPASPVPGVPGAPMVPGAPTAPSAPGDSAVPALPLLPLTPSVGTGPTAVLDQQVVGGVVHDAGLCPVTAQLGVHFSACAGAGSDGGSGSGTPTVPGSEAGAGADGIGDVGSGSGVVPTNVCVGLAGVLGVDPSLCHDSGTGSATPAGTGTSADTSGNVGVDTPAVGNADTTPLNARCTRTTSASSIPSAGDIGLGALLALFAYAAGRTRRRFGALNG
jgi:hypothetical protein